MFRLVIPNIFILFLARLNSPVPVYILKSYDPCSSECDYISYYTTKYDYKRNESTNRDYKKCALWQLIFNLEDAHAVVLPFYMSSVNQYVFRNRITFSKSQRFLYLASYILRNNKFLFLSINEFTLRSFSYLQ